MGSHLCWCGVEAVEASFESLKSSSLPMGASPASARTAAPRAVADSVGVMSANSSASSMGLPAAGPAHPLVVGRLSQRALWILDVSFPATRLPAGPRVSMIALMMYRLLVAALSSRAPIEFPLSSPPQSRL